MSLDEETTSGGGFMIEAFAEKDNDMSSVILVASEFHSRRVIIELTRQAAQAARIAHATAAEFAEARRLARAQLDAWQDFPASSGQWTRERKSKAPMMTDIELEGGPLMALGLRLPPLVGAVGAPIPHLPSSYCLPGAEMTELRKKCICVVPATQANKDMLKRIFERQMNFGDDMDISEDGPVRVWGFEEMDIAAWFRYWPTTPAAAGLAAPAALVAPVAPVL